MSRIERERWLLTQERWPEFQVFMSENFAEALLGDAKALAHHSREVLADIPVKDRSVIADQCWDFLTFFRERYDDMRVLSDAFGIRGKWLFEARGTGEASEKRVKIVYDALAESIRKQVPDWKPTPLGLSNT